MMVEMPNFLPSRDARVDLPVPDVPQIRMTTPLSRCKRESASFKVGWKERACTMLATTSMRSSLHNTPCENLLLVSMKRVDSAQDTDTRQI